MRKLVIFLCVMLLFTFTSYADTEYGTGCIDFEPMYDEPSFTMDYVQDSGIKLFSARTEKWEEPRFTSPYVSSVKNQGNGNNCWAFAVAGAMESYLLSQGDEERNFSENHMQYMISNRNNNPFGYNIEINSGGNIQFVSPYLMNRKGPVDDKNDVYDLSTTARDYSETANIPLSNYVVTGIAILPNLTEASDHIGYNELKQAHIKEQKKMIVKYGATMCEMDSCGFIGDNSCCYLGKECLSCKKHPTNVENGLKHNIDHMVLVVGWDDNYNRKKFEHTTPDGQVVVPEGNGAFLVKNSWGGGSGESGYFHLSYYDCFATETVSAITGMKKRETDEIVYSYDDYIPNVTLNFNTSEVYYGNQFKRKTENEVLDEIVFYGNKNHIYDFYLVNENLVPSGINEEGYVRFENCIITDEGYIIPNFEEIPLNKEEYIAEYTGYHTIDINDIPITSEQFSVVVHEKTQDGSVVEVLFEMNDANYGNQVPAVSEPFQSFFYPYFVGFFQDTGADGYNAPVKAITKTKTKAEKYTDISFVNFTDESKAEKTTFNEGDTVRIAAVVDGVNLDKTTLICAIYNGNKLVKVLDKTMGNKGNVFEYQEIPADFDNCIAKVFAIDALGNIKPLGNARWKYGNEAHIWDAGKIAKNPTHLEYGVKVYTCEACGKKKQPYDKIEKTPEHTYGNWVSVDSQNHKKVCACGDEVTETHNFVDGVCKVCGYKEGTEQIEQTE